MQSVFHMHILQGGSPPTLRDVAIIYVVTIERKIETMGKASPYGGKLAAKPSDEGIRVSE